MKIGYSERFLKQQGKAPENVREALKERLRIFARDKFNIILNNHQLTGKMKGLRSINVNGDWRALFEELSNGDVIFKAIGTHSQLYGK
ncbi:MAG: type II toxin-antitoxin system mRNA interferase toxin, RelE/StbE family [Candidatus Pacebacteria bacterium]|jgi:addiction module RelE/StbE family toxin|nr:type II toxin-antitoxin system mRNA interferase toxin, RelE/StbE family [Candidatus Paceibacterota bacterium]